MIWTHNKDVPRKLKDTTEKKHQSCLNQNLKCWLPTTDNWVTSIAPTQIHFAVSTPKATGRDCKQYQSRNTCHKQDKRQRVFQLDLLKDWQTCSPIALSPSMLLKSLTMAMPSYTMGWKKLMLMKIWLLSM